MRCGVVTNRMESFVYLHACRFCRQKSQIPSLLFCLNFYFYSSFILCVYKFTPTQNDTIFILVPFCTNEKIKNRQSELNAFGVFNFLLPLPYLQLATIGNANGTRQHFIWQNGLNKKFIAELIKNIILDFFWIDTFLSRC